MSRPGRGLEYRLTVAATATDPIERMACVGFARRALRAAATGWGITGGALDDLVAVASELIANAATHNKPGTIDATLRLAPPGDRLRVEVGDGGNGQLRPQDRFGDGAALTGRGLLMVDALTDQWGAMQTPAGKTVWAELVLPTPLDIPAVTRQTRRAVAAADVVAASRLRTQPLPRPACATRGSHLG
ncbi:ATP-binding protein [Kitasatospora kifunensis]|uniref:Anti-sigma regulatory factor (Ser/Thr protein kinase) n=1 Tax=Kitasatospora kifunensis TaxID=58351 RepID=A0A7W7RBI9_KITKI|nr:ATP-binding protein [Kitasatospora kifunensis]MBB4928957.1 anti-sigma regulatory factor (Ser/Thr protein kinase) [Kitasatospora kifunensis]